MIGTWKSSPFIQDVDGVQYRFMPSNDGWEVSRRCDCALGPHWHVLGWGSSITPLVESLRAGTLS